MSEAQIKWLENAMTKAYTNYKKMTENDKARNDLLGIIFEKYVAMKLTQENKGSVFKTYEQLSCEFKSQNQLSAVDTGIDLCDEKDTIVQCKYYSGSVNWSNLGTFFGSQNNVDLNTGLPFVRWPNMVVAHVTKLGGRVRRGLIRDAKYDREEFKEYLKTLDETKLTDTLCKQMEKLEIQEDSGKLETDTVEDVKQPEIDMAGDVKQPEPDILTIELPPVEKPNPLRPYQRDYVSWVKNTGNRIVHLPTGAGKTRIIIFSITGKSLILTPRINLAEDITRRCRELRPELSVSQIGGGETNPDLSADVTVVVYNSIHLIEDFSSYDKIFIDEAHHVASAAIYEDCDVKSSFSKKMADLAKYNNNVYLSATIDPRENFEYKCTPLRDMIKAGYLSDYYITVPVFSKDPTNSAMCDYILGHDLRDLLIFAPSVKDAIEFSNALNAKCHGFSAVVHSGCQGIPGTTKKQRKKIEDDFKNERLSCIVNYSIYSEGSDLPNVTNILMLRMPGSKTAIVQIVGRGLRICEGKPELNIIIPTSSEDERSSLKKFVKVLAENDYEIAKAVRSTEKGNSSSRLSIVLDDEESEFLGEEIIRDFTLIRSWYVIFDEVKKFVGKHKRLPKQIEENGMWINAQSENYKKNKGSMLIPDRRELIKNLFISVGEENRLIVPDRDPWYDKFGEVKKFVEEYNRLPLIETEENGSWINNQSTNYKKNKGSMSIPNRRELIKNLFISVGEGYRINEGRDPWYDTFDEVKKFAEEHKRLPKQTEENGIWVNHQSKHYKKNKQSMSIPDRRELIKNLFIFAGEGNRIGEGRDPWYDIFDNVQKFTEEHKRLPIKRSEENGLWVTTQSTNYKKNKYSMSIPDRRELIKNLFISVGEGYRINEGRDPWYDTFEDVKKFVEKHKRLPKRTEENGIWVHQQSNDCKKNKYSMSIPDRRELIKNLFISVGQEKRLESKKK